MADKIQKRIVEFMSDLEWPATTEDIAKGAKVSWNTAQVHLMRLEKEGKVRFRRVGRQNQWWLNKSYSENFKEQD